MKIRALAVTLSFISFVVAGTFAAPPVRAFTLSNFETPESVIVDSSDGSYFVSNINGNPADKDGNGYISKINAQGSIVIQKFIGGKEPLLDAPKGLALRGDTLYVADIDRVKAFHKDTGRLEFLVDLALFNARFLNDVAIDAPGNLYVSDTMADRIYKISALDRSVSVFKEGKELGSPNGLTVNPKTRNLIAVTWESGKILEIERSGKVRVLKSGLRQLDGVDYDAEGNLYVSSFGNGEIYKIVFFGRGPLSTHLTGLTTPADISVDRRKTEILIPLFNGNTIVTYRKGE